MSKRISTLIACLAIIISAGAQAPAVVAASQTAFSGRATVVDGTVAGIPITLVDTGPVAPEGGALSATLLCYPGAGCTFDVPDLTGGMLELEVLHAAVVAQGSRSSAEASAAELSLDVAGHNISAAFLQARASASCSGSTAAVAGSSELASLTIDGQTVSIGTAANQRIDLAPVGFVIVNEQVGSATADRGDITVSALHIVIPGPVPGTDTNVVVARAHADILCATPPPPPCPQQDFVTGGGWITTPSGSRGTFAVAGGLKNGVFWGHLLFSDHGTGFRAKGSAVTGYLVTGDTSRRITGTSDKGPYTADVADNGEPGRSDTFFLTLPGYAAGGPLRGGNLQLHCR